MKLNKRISRGLVLSLFVSNLNSLVFANSEISNRYETLEGKEIVINNYVEGELEEIEIFGNTVQDPNDLNNIESVGDLYIDNNGNPILDKQGRKQYKINITTNNKNLFNHSGSKEFYTGLYTDTFDLKEDGTIVCRPYSSNLNFIVHNDISPIKPDTTYTLSYMNLNSSPQVRIGLKFFDKDNNVIQDYIYGSHGYNEWYNMHYFEFLDQNEEITFKTPIDAAYYQTAYLGVGVLYEIKNVQLEENNKRTSYIKREKSEIELLLPSQLNKVKDVADKLYWDNNRKRYIIEKNIKEIILDGTSNWVNCNRDIDNTMYFQREPIDIIGTWGEPYLISDKLRTYDNLSLLNNSNEGICTGSVEGLRIEVRILKSRLNNESVAGFTSWLNSNPISVYYASTQPVLLDTNITSKFKMPTYDEKTHIYVNSENGINPTLKVIVDILPQLAKNSVEEAKINSTSSNISLARMYINMLPGSLYKDQLQEQLNQLFSSDTILNRETVSANLDVYIKSSNMLSLSLDTNSITFDGYSGVEDMEMLGVVNLTINSSLPYQLNAYMPSEITNSNKSNTLPIDILNIKESSESTYQQFADTTNKVVLKSDCAKGNGNIHSIDLKLQSDSAHKADVYKTTIKFEAEQK